MFNEIGIGIVILGLAFLIYMTYKNYEPQVKKFIRDHIVDCHDLHQDPRCFDCGDGNDECVKYPDCRHIRLFTFKMERTNKFLKTISNESIRKEE